MDKFTNLSGSDGTLVLMEYSEEFPPLLSRPRMASKVLIYGKKIRNKKFSTL